jgi:serine/threonine protein kinase
MKSADSSKFLAGERVPGTDWVMHRVLGAGGHGVVLEVRKGRHLRKAMKVLHPAVAGRASFESRFADEVQVLARLHHPNIVDVADCGVLADGSPFLLMELLQGRTLRAVVRQMPIPFTAAAVRQIAGQMCAGLGHAHGSHPPVVHRDIKPDNVFLHAPRPLESHVKLLDFGIAYVLDATRSPDPPLGTLRYAAPEVLDHGPIGAKADLYALAIVVYELLTQGFPWRVDFGSAKRLVEAHRTLEPLAPSRWKPWIPKSVDACLLRALSKNPDDRQRSVAEFDEELGDLEVVNDGSAAFQMDAPTAPTVATMARGGLTPISDVSRPSPVRHAERGGWLEAARSRLPTQWYLAKRATTRPAVQRTHAEAGGIRSAERRKVRSSTPRRPRLCPREDGTGTRSRRAPWARKGSDGPASCRPPSCWAPASWSWPPRVAAEGPDRRTGDRRPRTQ